MVCFTPTFSLGYGPTPSTCPSRPAHALCLFFFTAVYDDEGCRIEVSGMEGFLNRTDVPREKQQTVIEHGLALDCMWVVTVADGWKVRGSETLRAVSHLVCTLLNLFSPFSHSCLCLVCRLSFPLQIQLSFIVFKLEKPNDCESNFVDVFTERTDLPSR